MCVLLTNVEVRQQSFYDVVHSPAVYAAIEECCHHYRILSNMVLPLSDLSTKEGQDSFHIFASYLYLRLLMTADDYVKAQDNKKLNEG